jgi:hypothetical protein
MSFITNAESPQYGTYIDRDTELKPWMQYPTSDTSKDWQMELAMDAACVWIQNEFFGRPIAPRQYDWRFDGWTGFMGAYIMLPFYPVLEIISVTEYRGQIGHALTELQPAATTGDGFQVSYATGRLTRAFVGNIQRPWFGGSRNIEVVWVAGYNPVPPNIRMATLNLAAHWFRHSEQQGALRSGMGASGRAQHTDPVWGDVDQLGGSNLGVSMG